VQLVMAIVVAAVLVLVALMAVVAGPLSNHRVGRVLLLCGLGLLPLVVTGAGLAQGMYRSSQTSFCLSCHEMEAYGASLFVDNSQSLAAAHYQQRLIDRDQTCFACHTDYAMFGTAKAKLNGLKHVWVHYFSRVPEPGQIKLYAPYPNYNCLHCHDDARGYLEVEDHKEHAQVLSTGERSCLSCHEVAHDHEGVKAKNFWQGE
jgi:cytochrome c-type protein NapC